MSITPQGEPEKGKLFEIQIMWSAARLVDQAFALCNRLAPKDRTQKPSELYNKAYRRYLRRLDTFHDGGRAFEIQTDEEDTELEAQIDDYERAFMDEPLYDDDDDEPASYFPDCDLDYDDYQEESASNRSYEEAHELYGDNYGPPYYSLLCAGCDGSGDCYCVDYLDGERLTDRTCYDCGGTGACRSCHGSGTNE